MMETPMQSSPNDLEPLEKAVLLFGVDHRVCIRKAEVSHSGTTHTHTFSLSFTVFSCGFVWKQKYLVGMDGKASPNVSLFGVKSMFPHVKAMLEPSV